MTQAGVILGTAAYMSPEQAKGRQADKRSDVWAFGCVLYEMLTGKRAFEGEDVSDTLAAVLRGEPDQDRMPADVPASIRSLIDGCLKKDRKQRIGDISTALFLLRQPPNAPAPASTMQAAQRPLWRRAMSGAGGRNRGGPGRRHCVADIDAHILLTVDRHSISRRARRKRDVCSLRSPIGRSFPRRYESGVCGG